MNVNIYIYEPVPKGAHIPRHIFAVCFQKIKTSFPNKSVLSPLHTKRYIR